MGAPVDGPIDVAVDVPLDVPVLVLHDVGDESGGSAWLAAFESTGWPGPVLAPDLPGHAGRPAPVGGAYELADAAFFGARLLTDAGFVAASVLGPAPGRGPDGRRPVVVGAGVNGWSATLLALGDRAAGLVLVDGLNGPWNDDPVAAVEEGARWMRSVSNDPVAMAPAPPDGPDPRLRHGLPPHGDRRLAERAAAALTVPVLVIEGPASGLTPAESAALVERMASASIVPMASPTPLAVAEAAASWWAGIGSRLP